jgi:hypothetical protein
MYTGSESAPTMETGEFGPHVLYVFANSNQVYLTAFQNVLAVATPEPSTLPTLGSGNSFGTGRAAPASGGHRIENWVLRFQYRANAATPFGVPTYTLPLTMVGTMNLFPAPN